MLELMLLGNFEFTWICWVRTYRYKPLTLTGLNSSSCMYPCINLEAQDFSTGMLESKKYGLICGVNLEIRAWVHNSHEHLIDWDPPFRTSKLVKWTQPLLLLLEDGLRSISINQRSMWLTFAQKSSWFETSSSNSYGKFQRCWTWIDDLNMDWALKFQLSPT